MKQARVTIEVGNDGVAIVTIANPPVNALSHDIFDGLKEKFAEAMTRDEVKAVVLTGYGGKFSGGFDINVFEMVHKTGDISVLPDVSVDIMVNLIEDAKKPTVAAIGGLALGGALELALACHARIAAPKIQLGLPELTLGVIPGGGGTPTLRFLNGMKELESLLTVTLIAISAPMEIACSLDSCLGIGSAFLSCFSRWYKEMRNERTDGP